MCLQPTSNKVGIIKVETLLRAMIQELATIQQRMTAMIQGRAQKPPTRTCRPRPSCSHPGHRPAACPAGIMDRST